MFHSFHHTFTTTSREEKHIYPLLLSTHTNTSILYTHSINLNIEQAGRSKLTPARYQPSPSLASTTCTPKKHKIRICDCELPLSPTSNNKNTLHTQTAIRRIQCANTNTIWTRSQQQIRCAAKHEHILDSARALLSHRIRFDWLNFAQR